MKRNFKAAIFDLDGVLLDSLDVWEKIDKAFFAKRGLTMPHDYFEKINALSFAETAKYTIELFGLPDTAPALLKEWNDMAIYEYSHKIRLKPFASEYLHKLKSAKIKLAVATTLPEELYKPCLLNNKIYDLFDVCCSVTEVKHGKESPDVFLLASKRLETPVNECVVFEDVLPAVKSAKQAGMIVYGVYDKHSAHEAKEIKKTADCFLYSLRELL